MNRSLILFVLVGAVFVTAIGLRVHSYLRDGSASTQIEARTDGRPLGAEPADYVAHPVVALDEIDHGPQRLISIAPNITETLCAMGLRDRLVGRTPFCKYPPGITDVKAVGAIADTNYELITSLEPDLILVTANSRSLIDNLNKLEWPVLPVPHETLDDVYRAIEQIGQQCERPATARALIQLIRSDLDRLSRAAVGRPLRVAITTGPMPVPARSIFVAGPGSYLDDLLQLTGHTNAVAAVLDSPFGEIPIEKLLQIDPDVILEFRDDTDAQALEDVYAVWSKVGRLRAIEGRRVRTVGSAEWLSAGPRIAIALHRMILALSDSG